MKTRQIKKPSSISGWGERPREPRQWDELRNLSGSRGRSPHRSPIINHQSPVTDHGFTLMEIMLALAVSAVVLVAIGGVFYSAVRLRERTQAMLDESTPLQQAFNFIRHDLQGALPPGGGNLPLAGDFKLQALGSGLGANYHVEFFTTSGAVNDNSTFGDIQSISYELRDSADRTRNNNGKDLVRSVNRNVLATAMQDPQEQPLLSNVQSLEFSCFDGANWRDSWDTSLGDTNLPYAVRVRIQLAGDSSANARAQHPFEIVVPLVSQSRTNVPQTTTSGS
jgi:general secretion pathway protein J